MNRFLAILLVALLLAPLAPADAASKKADPAPTPLEAATVNIYCRIKLGGRTFNSTGSGVFISDRGVILTNAHVGQYFLLSSGTGKSKSACKIRTGSPARDAYNASLLYISPQWLTEFAASVENKTAGVGTGYADFALLYVTGTTKGELPAAFPSIPLADEQTVGTTQEGVAVSIAGYPAEKLSYEGILDKLKKTTVSSTITDIRSFDRPFSDIFVIAPSKAGQQGVSGGPVLDDSDDLIGLVTTIGGTQKNGERSVRAVSLVHMNRIAAMDTGLPFTMLYVGEFAARAKLTELSFPFDVRSMLETRIRQIR